MAARSSRSTTPSQGVGKKPEVPASNTPPVSTPAVQPSADVPGAVIPTGPTIGDTYDVTKLNNEDLMKLCQEGDESAFEELFNRFNGPALSFIYRMIGDRNRTEAIGQEAFLRIFKEAKSYQYPRSFATWFYTIVRNLCKTELRWRSRHPTVSLDEPVRGGGHGDSDGGISWSEQLPSGDGDPVDVLTGQELHIKLEKALLALPDVEREILILKRFQGLKYKEIAEVMDLPVSSVRNRIQSALDTLRKSIKEYL